MLLSSTDIGHFQTIAEESALHTVTISAAESGTYNYSTGEWSSSTSTHYSGVCHVSDDAYAIKLHFDADEYVDGSSALRLPSTATDVEESDVVSATFNNVTRTGTVKRLRVRESAIYALVKWDKQAS